MTLDRPAQIFISYAAVDNGPGGGWGWVDQFHRALAIGLRRKLGFDPVIWQDPAVPEREEGVRIQRDPKRPLSSMAALHDAAVLLCLVSPGYLQSDRCRWQLEEYLNERADAENQRIFKIVTRPVPIEGQPQPLARMLGYEFYAIDAATGRTRTLNMGFGENAEYKYWLLLDDLAHDLAKVLVSDQDSERERREASPFMADPRTLLVVEPDAEERALRVFLCHASDDKDEVKALYRYLRRIGVDPWLDEEKLLPGQLWESEIRKAVKASDSVVICLSRKSLTKRGYVQKEIRFALDAADEHPEGALFLIPAKLEDCEAPERLSNRHWVNLLEDRGLEKLVRTLQARALELTVAAEVMRG